MSIPYPDLTVYATNLEAEHDCMINTIWLWGEIEWYTRQVLNMSDCMRPILLWNYLFYIYTLFCKGLEMMRSADKICTASHTYIHVLSLCHLYPLPFTWRIQMRTFKRYFSHTILLTTLHLREMN
jgi:hypothetical protein